MSGALLAAFLFGCFLFGVLSVRTLNGVVLVAAMFCVMVYWIKPQLMVWVALFLTFASLTEGMYVGKVIGPVAVNAYFLALLVAIGYLIPIGRPRFSAYLLPGMFVLTVAAFAVVGAAAGHDAFVVARETTFLIEMVLGFMLALLIVQVDYVKESMYAMAVTLWFSAGMIVASSFGAVGLVGRAESLQEETGAAATRVITATETPATAILAALVAAQVVGRVRSVLFVALGAPALAIVLLSFSREALISVGVAVAVAFAAGLNWSGLRRTARFIAIDAAVFAAMVPGALFLLQHSSTGSWLGDQFTAFNHRVFGGVSADALAVDQSTLARLAEDHNLNHAIAQAPVFGHGLGYAYQVPWWYDDTPTAVTFQTTYSHNFYLWWLCKAGAVGMVAFAAFALTPVVRALRCASAPAKVSAAVSVGLLVACIVAPLPEEPAESSTLGIALGAAMAFANLRRRARGPDGRGSRDRFDDHTRQLTDV
jgi:hypothetical protein